MGSKDERYPDADDPSYADAFRLSEEDAQRMVRLSEEIWGRAEQFSRIIDRVVGRDRTGALGKLTVETESAKGRYTEVLYYVNGDLVAEGCYDSEERVCYPDACPSGE